MSPFSGSGRHRGPHPADRRLFHPHELIRLRLATMELSWLLSRGYVVRSSLKLIGDRHNLTQRQRIAVARCACADSNLAARRVKSVHPRDLTGSALAIDGFNLIISLETALSGGVVLLCRDGCVRDLASVHGSYRSVQETERALNLIGEALAQAPPASATWFLDRPVSNSGRLATRIASVAKTRGWPWNVRVVYDADVVLRKPGLITVTSDSSILDSVEHWVNLTAYIVRQSIPDAWLVDLGE